MFGGYYDYFLNKLYFHAFKMRKSDSKTFIMFQKTYVLNNYCSFELFMKKHEKKTYHGFCKKIKQHNCFDNKKSFLSIKAAY